MQTLKARGCDGRSRQREGETAINPFAAPASTATPTPGGNPAGTIQLAGISLVGINLDTGKKLLFTLIFIAALLALRFLLYGLTHLLIRGGHNERVRFWTGQGVSLTVALIGLIGLISIWFNNPSRLAAALGLVSAGVAFALQKVITAIAAYFVILRGKTFNVGDRITMGGVRGDVIALGFIQTTLMEMGEPPSVQSAEPAMWVKSRQYTGRVVTVTNDKIFEQPVYNFTRDFPYLWEEMHIPIPYQADRAKAEEILLECAKRNTVPVDEMSAEALQLMYGRYHLHPSDVEPRVYYRLTDNWLELTVRFIYAEHGIRDVKDAMSRDIITAFDNAGIGIASGTYDIVGLPPIRIQSVSPLPGMENGQAAQGG